MHLSMTNESKNSQNQRETGFNQMRNHHFKSLLTTNQCHFIALQSKMIIEQEGHGKEMSRLTGL